MRVPAFNWQYAVIDGLQRCLLATNVRRPAIARTTYNSNRRINNVAVLSNAERRHVFAAYRRRCDGGSSSRINM